MKTRLLFLPLMFLFLQPLFAVESEPQPAVETYDQLIAAIRGARAASQGRIEAAVRQEKVREAWEIGRLIDEHILLHKERADYGKQVITRLSKDLRISETELYYMLQFARAYPIFRAPGKLSWAHYETLLSVNDSVERDMLEEKAAKENWTQDQMRAEVKKHNALKSGRTGPASENGGPPVHVPLVAVPGKVGTYRYLKATVGPETGKGVIDLGFSNYYRTSKDLNFKDGTVIEVRPAFKEGSSPSDKIKSSKRTPRDLYTYRAWVVNVLDGDTVKAVVDLGFGVRSVQVLRLRGLDAPEMESAEGKEAKAALEKMLGSPIKTFGDDSAILIRTVKSDKYDRYLADIWVGETYVNQELINQGFAVQVSE